MLTVDDRQVLLRLARCALEARVRRLPLPQPEASGVLGLPSGAFVSIHRGEALRGCLGRITCDLPLVEVITHLAAVVADSDPRFAAVHPAELDDLEIEISVLTREREVASIADIEVGRHGLIIEHGIHRGLLLPQVASDHGWSVEQFVEHTCVKAGLPLDAWRRGARVSVFEAEVFSERSAARW